MNENQVKAYAAITLNLLYKMKVKVSPEVLTEQMDLVFDLYDPEEIEAEYNKLINSNRIILRKNNSRVGSYIIDVFNSANEQLNTIDEFCKKHKMLLKKIFIAPPGINQEKYYELIRDIRNKEIDVLIIAGLTILGFSTEEYAVLVKLCRKHDVNIIEI